MNTRTRLGGWLGALAAIMLLGVAGARVAFGDAPPAALFRGGLGHGYDEDLKIDTTDTRRSRNHGGARDGYAVAALADVKVPGPSGTLIRFR